jgi:hypothetical protein
MRSRDLSAALGAVRRAASEKTKTAGDHRQSGEWYDNDWQRVHRLNLISAIGSTLDTYALGWQHHASHDQPLQTL